MPHFWLNYRLERAAEIDGIAPTIAATSIVVHFA